MDGVIEIFNQNINIVKMIAMFLVWIAGVITALTVLWKIFGPKIKVWIKNVMAAEITSAQCETETKLLSDIAQIQRDLSTLTEKVERQEDVDMALLGNSIVRATKEFCKQGWVDGRSYDSIHAMNNLYKKKNGNGYVKKQMQAFEKLEVR